ncbi:MAG: hypothetical protein AB7Q97_20765 [Gammaproteobacteria bacterium]
MAVHVLEINDTELRLMRGAEVLACAPGVACLEPDRVVVGSAAARQSRLNPRRIVNRYWSRLSQDPLPAPSRHARHHADLAYAQLLDLHRAGGGPEELVIAVPGSFSREQLALLLGICAAAPFRPVGLVDAAVAALAGTAGPGSYTHVDIGVHEAVITHLGVGEHVRRLDVEVIGDCGLETLIDACAAHVAEQFIQQTRFDPLHHAQSDQAVYDALPGWLAALEQAATVEARIDMHGEHRARLAREALHEVLAPFHARIRARIPQDANTLLSHRAGRLPGLAQALSALAVLAPEALMQGVARQADRLRAADGAVHFLTRLEAAPAPIVLPRGQGEERVTHVLAGHRAWAIGTLPLYLDPAGTMHREAPPVAGCNVVRSGLNALLRADAGVHALVNGQPVRGVVTLAPGDELAFAGGAGAYRFIAAVPAHGA